MLLHDLLASSAAAETSDATSFSLFWKLLDTLLNTGDNFTMRSLSKAHVHPYCRGFNGLFIGKFGSKQCS